MGGDCVPTAPFAPKAVRIRTSITEDICATQISWIRDVTVSQRKQVCPDYGVLGNLFSGEFVAIANSALLELGVRTIRQKYGFSHTYKS
jgi:hypothetical protein